MEYVPEEEGEYDVNVKYDDRHIPDSPFKVGTGTVTSAVPYRT